RAGAGDAQGVGAAEAQHGDGAGARRSGQCADGVLVEHAERSDGANLGDLRPRMPTAVRQAYEELKHPTVVVIGGGFAGLELIKRLEGRPYKVLLLDKQNHHCFQPLLYQVATASLSADSIAHPFRRTVAPM